MKIATGTVVKSAIIMDDPEFKDGTDVFILTREREDEVHRSPEELAELEVKGGQTTFGWRFRRSGRAVRKGQVDAPILDEVRARIRALIGVN